MIGSIVTQCPLAPDVEPGQHEGRDIADDHAEDADEGVDREAVPERVAVEPPLRHQRVGVEGPVATDVQARHQHDDERQPHRVRREDPDLVS